MLEQKTEFKALILSFCRFSKPRIEFHHHEFSCPFSQFKMQKASPVPDLILKLLQIYTKQTQHSVRRRQRDSATAVNVKTVTLKAFIKPHCLSQSYLKSSRFQNICRDVMKYLGTGTKPKHKIHFCAPIHLIQVAYR